MKDAPVQLIAVACKDDKAADDELPALRTTAVFALFGGILMYFQVFQ